MSARIHTHTSNRAKPPQRVQPDKKAVFKSVLESPYRIQWPYVPLNLQNTILARLLSVLEGVSEYNSAKDKAHRHGKRARRDSNASRIRKKIKAHDQTAVQTDAISDMVVDSASTDAVAVPPKPPILDHIVVGINEITRRLETQIRDLRTAVKVSSKEIQSLSDSRREIKLIFVCRDDIDPQLLISHIPHLIGTYNSARPSEPIKTVALPKDSEGTLANVMGLRRAAILAFDAECPTIDEFQSLLQPISAIAAPWLTAGDELVPTHIKQLRTSAPADMKASKEQRVAGRKAAKEAKKGKSEAKVTT
ncbi:hypothetical protein EYR40_003710 [Pleurotus pulmonarius]|nr:hypothetical protein EYR36_007717 [Pleurotus pulmonarius]KAF4604927.1 hypothetical protein EYR40_003710 [Pleurotus pulmonarius]KAF4606423.1 hypothetical protein EYR38_000477 [Pleurotus pulmonarius]